MQWGKRKDNYISIYKKSRQFKFWLRKSGISFCYKRLRVSINNPLYDVDNSGWIWNKA